MNTVYRKGGAMKEREKRLEEIFESALQKDMNYVG